MTSPTHLLDQARLLCGKSGRPRDTDLKRATSTVYYALFHAVAEKFADTLVGGKNRLSPAWTRASRALDHGKARQEFKRVSSLKEHSAKAELSYLFLELQELRHVADYDPNPMDISRVGVVALVRRAAAVVAMFSYISPDEWRELATTILMGARR